MLLPRPLPKILFVTGTDTNCGKTTVAQYLLKNLSEQGLSTIGLKPIVSGGIEDVEILRSSATIRLPFEQCNQYSYPDPIAPHIAAQWHNNPIELEKLIQQFESAQRHDPDVIVIEGAGGWLVPLNNNLWFVDFVRAINAQILLVVGMKLGCLNHALLTARVIQQDELHLYAWVANIFDENMIALNENICTLDKLIAAPRLNFFIKQPVEHDLE